MPEDSAPSTKYFRPASVERTLGQPSFTSELFSEFYYFSQVHDDRYFVQRRNAADVIAFDTSTANTTWAMDAQAAGEGAYVIIARDNITNPPTDAGRMNGRVYRLGARRTDLDNTVASISNSIVFELQPSGDFSKDPGANGVQGTPTPDADDIIGMGYNAGNVTVSGRADAFIIGKTPTAFDNNGNPTTFEGGVQDITLYTTFIQLK